MPIFSVDHINITFVDAYFVQEDNASDGKVNETQNFITAVSPACRVEVEIETSESFADRNWCIGFVPACDFLECVNKYGNFGRTSWELHPLKSRRQKMVNDTCGTGYPFCGSTHSKCIIPRGHVSNNVIDLHLDDALKTSSCWKLRNYGEFDLTEVTRRNDFWVWLIAIKRGSTVLGEFDITKDSFYVLKTIRWNYKLHMRVDSLKSLGHRLTYIKEDCDEPNVLEYPFNKSVPMSAMRQPYTNNAQSLIWYPNNNVDKPVLLTPPSQIIVPWQTWLSEMLPGQKLDMTKPENCNLVREWSPDFDLQYLDDCRAPSYIMHN